MFQRVSISFEFFAEMILISVRLRCITASFQQLVGVNLKFLAFSCLTRQPRVRPVRRKPSLLIYRVHAPRRAESAS